MTSRFHPCLYLTPPPLPSLLPPWKPPPPLARPLQSPLRMKPHRRAPGRAIALCLAALLTSSAVGCAGAPKRELTRAERRDCRRARTAEGARGVGAAVGYITFVMLFAAILGDADDLNVPQSRRLGAKRQERGEHRRLTCSGDARESAGLDDARLEELVDAATAANDRGDFEEAVWRYRLAVDARPEATWLRIRLATALHQLGRDDEAELELRHAQWQRPGGVETPAGMDLPPIADAPSMQLVERVVDSLGRELDACLPSVDGSALFRLIIKGATGRAERGSLEIDDSALASPVNESCATDIVEAFEFPLFAQPRLLLEFEIGIEGSESEPTSGSRPPARAPRAPRAD